MIEIKKNIELKNYTTFKIGGPAKFFVKVGNESELIKALEYAKENDLKFFILGGGSNILVSDKGFDGLIIKFLPDNEYEMRDTTIESWAGNSLAGLINFATEKKLGGLEELAGIPGTIGGAIKGNAGAYSINETGIGKLIEKVKVLDIKDKSLKIKIYPNEECIFSYRESIFKKNENLVILAAVFNLKNESKEQIKEKINQIIKKRTQEKPWDWKGSAGSFYKNPKVNNQKLIAEFEKDTGRKAVGGNIIPAFWLISQVGLSGKQIGRAKINEKNSNFIINIGEAKAEEIIILSSLIKQKVRNKFGVQLPRRGSVNWILRNEKSLIYFNEKKIYENKEL